MISSEPITPKEIAKKNRIQDFENTLPAPELEKEPEIDRIIELETESEMNRLDLEKVESSISILKKVVRKRIVENPKELDEEFN